MILEQHPDLQQLSPADKLSLVTELWDDLASQPNGIPITPEQIAELDRRTVIKSERSMKPELAALLWTAVPQLGIDRAWSEPSFWA